MEGAEAFFLTSSRLAMHSYGSGYGGGSSAGSTYPNFGGAGGSWFPKTWSQGGGFGVQETPEYSEPLLSERLNYSTVAEVLF